VQPFFGHFPIPYSSCLALAQPIDIFDLEYISDPQISPDGERILYVRNFKDIMTDGNHSNVWMINEDGSTHIPLSSGDQNDRYPRWSPDGQRILYLSNRSGSSQIYMRWMQTGGEARISNLQRSPSAIQWSPNGTQLSLLLDVPVEQESIVTLPTKPKGAMWTDPPQYIDQLRYRGDGQGYLDREHTHLFLMPATGGRPRQVSFGEFSVSGDYSWLPDGSGIVIAANRREDRDMNPADTELYLLDISDGSMEPLTDRRGPDSSPRVSPDGKRVAYLGHDEEYLGYQRNRVYILDLASGKTRELTEDLDRNIDELYWTDASTLLLQYDVEGDTKIAQVDMKGGKKELTGQVGGLSIGRPYGGGSFSANAEGQFAFTLTSPMYPADLAVGDLQGEVRRLTRVNEDLLGQKQLGKVESFIFSSSYDDREVEGWIVTPPDFDPSKKYPLILEIHGGPFSNYGDRFSMEVQLYAAAGYVVLYTNPRGSTSYGSEFANLIHHNYPSQDYDDLMSGVNAVIERGYIDTDRLFVTGGSGGGVLTAWIVGKTRRFSAAVVAKPVINWYSFVLHADNPAFFYRYWFPGFPWDHQAHYMERSPISLVDQVETPTMLLTGENDYRTPMSETEQYYAALKLLGVPTAMVRIQDAGHGIVARPSNLINKVSYILAWFQRYDTTRGVGSATMD